jgi:hypothetical protein
MVKSQWFVNTPALPPSSVTSSTLLPARPFWRRWTVPVIGLTLLAVIGLLVLEIALLKNSAKRNDQPDGGPDEVVPTKATNDGARPEKVLSPRTDPAPKPPEEIVVRPEAKPATEVQKPARPPESILALASVLSRAHLYETYLNIGFLADAVAKDVYKVGQGKQFLTSINKVMDSVERQLAQLPVDELRPDEKHYLDKLRSVLSLLRSEITELTAYWETGDEEYVRKYQAIHANTWKELEKLLAEP